MLVALLLQTAAASAIVYVMPTDENMVDRSPIIVFGEVLSVQPGPAGASPTTEYLFAVEEVLKGFVGGSGIMVRQPGGVSGGTMMNVVGLPMLAVGNRVLLFLHPEENGAHSIVEYGLGIFSEARRGNQVFLLREPSLQGAVTLPGSSAAPEPSRRRGYRDAMAFRHWIADRARGTERPSDYFRHDLPERPTVAVSPFRLTHFCSGEPLPSRWRNFDRGQSVEFEVLSGGQPGMGGGGLSQVRAGMRAWNADPGSNVDLELAGTVSPAPYLGERNGENSITFEDPYDEVEGALVPDAGGTLALASTWSRCGAEHSVGSLRVREIVESNITTQDGFRRYLQQFDSRTAARAFQIVMTHELGHALGISHPCESGESSCNSTHESWGAIMWWSNQPHRELGTALHIDDRAAVRRLYPERTYSPAPDLVVESPSSIESSVPPGGAFTFYATVRNRGDDPSSATTLRYYRSSDSTITTSDTSVGTDTVPALSPSATDRQSIGLTAPETPGTYYYGACVDPVSGESNPANNCSSGVPVSVGGGEGNGVAAACRGDTCILHGQRFRVKARYSKDGNPGRSARTVEAALADSAGLFSGDSDSPELLVQIVNQCRTTGYWGVYAGVASDAEFSVAVRHVETNELKWFRTRDGQSIADTEAFACTRSDDLASPAGPGHAEDRGTCSGATCLLREDRFRVKSWYTGDSGSSRAADAVSVKLGESAGLFTFRSGNPELLVRIADTCSISGYWTVYAGTASDADFRVAIRDTETNELKWFRSRGGQPVRDAEAFACTGTDDETPPGDPGDEPETSACSGDTCLLQGERFRVKARFSKDGRPSRGASAVDAAVAASTGLFSAESGSPELLVRIVNRCRTTGYWEVYAGVASDADFSVAVRHVETNELKWFRTRNGQSIADTDAFACTRSDGLAAPAGPVGDPENATCSGVACLLQSDLFRVKTWYTQTGGASQAADAIPVDLGNPAGLFSFASGHPELLVRVADMCSTNGHWSVYAGAASETDFSVAIRVTDTNELKWFRSRGGQSVADAEAFACGDREPRVPDLVVSSASVSDASLMPGGTFTLNATVENQGTGRSASTSLRYYRSSDSTIRTSDAEVGTADVAPLPASRTSAESIVLTAPSTSGTYYYGACVDPVPGESATGNNCSPATRVTVANGGSSVREYRYDNGTFESVGWLETSSGPVYEQEFAERFRLTRSGQATYVVLCVGRDHRGTTSRMPFTLSFYRDSGGAPGTRIRAISGHITIATPGTGACLNLDLTSVSSLQLASGYTWVGLAWRNSTGLALGIDRDGAGGGRPRVRARVTSGSQWLNWQEHPDGRAVRTFGIRLGVDHGESAARFRQ